MTISYKLVFSLAIIMAFLSLLGGSRSGLGVIVWGYTAWLMYKKDNKMLVELYRTLIWITAGLGLIGFLAIIFFDGVDRTIGLSASGYIFIIIVMLAIDYFLYRYFKKCLAINNSPSELSQFTVKGHRLNQENDELIWGKVLSEFESEERNSGLWAKCFAHANGDEAQAKAAYLKERFLALTHVSEVKQIKIDDALEVNEQKVEIQNKNSKTSTYKILGLDLFLGIALIALLVFSLAMFLNKGESKQNNYEVKPILNGEYKSDWKERVNFLRKEIVAGRMYVNIASATTGNSVNDIKKRPWNTYRKVLSSSEVSTVEKSNTWWFEKPNNLFIRLSNTTPDDFLGVIVEMSSGSCSGSKANIKYVELNFEKPFISYSDAIFKTELPFPYMDVYGKGTQCLDVVAVFSK